MARAGRLHSNLSVEPYSTKSRVAPCRSMSTLIAIVNSGPMLSQSAHSTTRAQNSCVTAKMISPTMVPLMRIYCRSRPTVSSIRSVSVSVSQFSTTLRINSAISALPVAGVPGFSRQPSPARIG